MYIWLFVVVGLIYLWLLGGTFAAWRSRGLRASLAVLSGLAWTGAAALSILFIGPYWKVIYLVLLQPG